MLPSSSPSTQKLNRNTVSMPQSIVLLYLTSYILVCLALGIFCDDDSNHVKCVLVVSFHVGVNIFILGFRNKILISFNQEFINRLRKY